MALKPQAQTSAILPGVAGQSVPTAQGNLRPFTNVSWFDTSGRQWSPPPSTYSVIPEPVMGRNPEEPAALIGRSVPTDTAIVITIAQAGAPK